MNVKTLIQFGVVALMCGCAFQVSDKSGNTRLVGLAKAENRHFANRTNAYNATRVQVAGLCASIDNGSLTVTAGSRVSQRFYQQTAPAGSSARVLRGLPLGNGWAFGWTRIDTGLSRPDAIISGEDLAGIAGRFGGTSGFAAGYSKERRTTLFAEDTQLEANFDGASSYGIFYIDPDDQPTENP